MSVWQQENGCQFLSRVNRVTWRIVEDQSISTTRKFVSTSEEHDLLEALIEQSKPKIKYYGDELYFKNLHYLLFTPFRYPPLKWGSRFGTKLERGIFYSACDLTTAMCEKAFYKLAFLDASEAKLGGKNISYTGFKINIDSERYIDLDALPFNQHEKKISSKKNYGFAQALGNSMREDSVECFQYLSARHTERRFNIGVFSPVSLQNNADLEQTFEHLNSYATKEVVEFSFKRRQIPATVFPRHQFLVEGKLPFPPSS